MISRPRDTKGALLMDRDNFTLDSNRQDRLMIKLDEILKKKGAELNLRSRQDVVMLAVQELWAHVVLSDSETMRFLQTSAAD
jgi:hypothetical protein